MIVLENDNGPSTNCKGDNEGMAGGVAVKSKKGRLNCSENYVSVSSHKEGLSNIEVKSQKDRLDCSASYVLVSCHLEMLRHSLSADLHLTQVFLPCFYLTLTPFYCIFNSQIGKYSCLFCFYLTL